MARPGRRPGDSRTREAILAAARAAFGELGYDRATIRRIADAAGVDPALVHHYFMTKADLYAAAIDVPFSPSEAIPLMLKGDPAARGERIARTFLAVWDTPEAREPLLGMVRGAFGGHEAGTTSFRQFVTHGLVARVAETVEGPDATLRTELAVAQLVGVAVLRYVVQVEPLASAATEEIVATVAPRLQELLGPP